MNPWNKTRPIDNPYYITSNGGWTWKILKSYHGPSKILGNRFARFHCAVRSPFTYGSWEQGDVYARDLPGLRMIVAQMEREAAEARRAEQPA